MGREVIVECSNHFAYTQQFVSNAKRTLLVTTLDMTYLLSKSRQDF